MNQLPTIDTADIKDHAPAHHPYGPSRWPGLLVCPGYEPSKDSGDDNDFAHRGTAAHEALETGDYSKLREEDREPAQWAANAIHALTQGLETEAEIATRIPLYEVFDLSAIGGITGTCDRRWETEDGSLHVGDFKLFSKIGINNYTAQMVGYALGSDRPLNDRVVFHIFHGGSMQVETFDLTWDECLAIAKQVAYSIANPDGPRCRSGHCDHCAKAGDCPESAKVVAFGALAAGRLTLASVRANPAEAARLCDWLDAAAKRIEEARDIIATVAKEGVPIEDRATGVCYAVQVRQGRAQVPPVSGIIGRLIDEDGVSREGVLERATLSLTALRELVGKARAEEYAVRGEDTLCFVRKPGPKALKN